MKSHQATVGPKATIISGVSIVHLHITLRAAPVCAATYMECEEIEHGTLTWGHFDQPPTGHVRRCCDVVRCWIPGTTERSMIARRQISTTAWKKTRDVVRSLNSNLYIIIK